MGSKHNIDVMESSSIFLGIHLEDTVQYVIWFLNKNIMLYTPKRGKTG